MGAGVLLAVAGCTATDGQPASQRPLGAGQAPAWTVPTADEPILARAAGDSTVIVATRSAILAVDRANGAQRWRFTVPAELEVAAQAVDDRLVITRDAVVLLGGSTLGTPRSAVVLDLATGQPRFAVHKKTESSGAPDQPEPRIAGMAVTNGTLVVARCALVCRFEARDLSTGQTRWTGEATGDFAVMPVPARRTLFERYEYADGTRVAEPTVVIVGLNPSGTATPPQTQYRYTVLDARTGQPAGEWKSDDSHLNSVIVDGVVFPSGYHCRQPVRATDARTGGRLWEAAAECGAVDLTGGVSGGGPNRPPTVVAGQALIFAPGGLPRLVDMTTGAVRWTSGSAAAPLGVANGAVVQRINPGQDDDVVSVDPTTGAERWRFRLPTGEVVKRYWLEGAAVLDDAIVLCGTEFAHTDSPVVLRVLDPATGRERWFSRDAQLIGAGSGWIMAARAEKKSPTTGGHELRMYRL
jgi:outer membrane protein assembly factor BamB